MVSQVLDVGAKIEADSFSNSELLLKVYLNPGIFPGFFAIKAEFLTFAVQISQKNCRRKLSTIDIT